jgi:Spy/CpxP family protein refolding chaperone
MNRTLLPLFLALALALAIPPATAQDDPTPSLDALRSELAQGKQIVVARRLNLTPEQEAGFWPIYDAHQAELAELVERRRDNAAAYARAVATGRLDEDAANALAEETLDIENEQAQLMERTFSRLRRQIDPAKAYEYLQLEAKISAILRYELAATLP